MSSSRRKGADKVVDFLKSETSQKIAVAVLIILSIAFFSGFIYSLSTTRPLSMVYLRGGGIRIFIWDVRMQTHAETIVVFFYYALGVAGLLLYARAVSRPADPRSTKYMLFFSFLLLLLSALGIYNGLIEKFVTPT